MHTVFTKALLTSKRGRAFISDLREAGVSKARSERVAKKFILLARPERAAKFVGERKGRRVYAVSRPAKGGKIFIYKSRGGVGLGGKALVIFAPSKNRRSQTKASK